MKNKELLFEISYGCNLKCIHCSSIGIDSKNIIKVNELPFYLHNTEKECNYLDEIKTVRLSGGEVSLLYNLESYVDFFKNKNIKVIVQTNGRMPIDKSVLRKVDEVWISLYGNEYIHDFITQQRGSYNSVNNTLIFYSEYLREFSKAKIVIQSPIFNEKQLVSLFCQMNTGLWNNNFNIELRLFTLLNQGRCKFALTREEQLAIYNSLQYKYYKTVITCSLDNSKCNFENKFVLKPDGTLFNCASHKHGMILCKK